jgi:hypothetical protein
MVDESLIDCVAEAIWQATSLRANNKPRGISWDEVGKPTHEEFVPLAKAAIAAYERLKR